MKSGKAPAIMGGDAQKEAAGMDELQLGDLVQMRKTCAAIMGFGR